MSGKGGGVRIAVASDVSPRMGLATYRQLALGCKRRMTVCTHALRATVRNKCLSSGEGTVLAIGRGGCGMQCGCVQCGFSFRSCVSCTFKGLCGKVARDLLCGCRLLVRASSAAPVIRPPPPPHPQHPSTVRISRFTSEYPERCSPHSTPHSMLRNRNSSSRCIQHTRTREVVRSVSQRR